MVGGPIREDVETVAQSYPDTPSALPVHQVMALLMSQLQPILDGFNCTLERLTQEVGGLSRDVAQLRSPQWEVQGEALGGGEVPGALEAKLEESYLQIEEVRRQLETQRADMDHRLHSQHAMLHYNITNLKTDIDVKIKRNHKMLQVNLQSMNASLSDMKLEQERLHEELQQRDLPTSPGPGDRRAPSQAQQPTNQALARLDSKVVNNTARVNGLADNMKDLTRTYLKLDENITQTGRNSQILFMEIGLEVEAAKVAVLSRITELDSNLTQQLQEVGSDVDYLYTQIYRNVSCDCKAFSAAVSRLEHALTNVTELANDNRLALDGSTETGSDHWAEVGWGPSMEDLQQVLQQVKDSLAFEQDRSRVLHHNVSHLLTSLLGSQRDILSLQENDDRLANNMRHLSSSFSSLLQDAIRHTDVLQHILGEEVLDFLDWPVQDQKARSIPALQESIRNMQGHIEKQNLSLASLIQAAMADAEEPPAADEPPVLTEWPSRGLERRSGDRRRIHPPMDSEDHPDYSDSDMWSVKKAVDELRTQVRRLEERPCPANCNSSKEAKLQAEVAWLRRGLEGHLQLFKSVFSNSEGLAGSESTLDLDRMWAMMKRKEGKRQRKSNEKREEAKEGVRGHMRSSRDTSAVSTLADAPLLFLASDLNNHKRGPMAFSATSLNPGQALSVTAGTFTAPVKGVYLFLLTLKFERGPSLVHLRTASTVMATLHQGLAEAGPATRVSLLQLEKGEVLHLQLAEGTLVNQPGVNTFAGLLLYQSP